MPKLSEILAQQVSAAPDVEPAVPVPDAAPVAPIVVRPTVKLSQVTGTPAPGSWGAISASPDFQKLDPNAQEVERARYFREVIGPTLPAGTDRVGAKRQFDEQTIGLDPDTGVDSLGRTREARQKIVADAAMKDAYAKAANPEPLARTAGENIARAPIFLARDVAHGLGSIPGLVIDPIMAGGNKLLEAFGSNARLPSTSQSIDTALGDIGVPEVAPENRLERYLSTGTRALTGAASGAGLAGTLAKGAAITSGVAPTASQLTTGQAVTDALAANPTAQLVSAGAGSASAQTAAEAGVGPVGQTIAGVLGGLVPSAPTLAASGVRGAIRGGEAGRQAVQDAINDFRAAGSAPTVGQATGSGVLQGAESMLAKTPGAATVMRNASERQGEQISAGADAIADSLSKIKDPAGAGRTIERGISGAGGFMDRFKAESSALYDRLDQHIPGDTRVPVTATADALKDLTATIPGAPALSKFFQNAKIGALKGALESDTQGTKAVLDRPGVPEQVDAIKDAAAAKNAQIKQAGAEDAAALDRDNIIRKALGMKPKAGNPPAVVDPSNDISGLLEQMVDGKLPYEAVKKLRTLVGEQVADAGLASDVPRSKWKALYGALSSDLKEAAVAQGPEAQQAWNRANTYYRAGQARIDQLARVVDKNGGPEAVFNAATSGTKDGATTLRATMQSLKPDEQKVLASVMVRRLGKANPGQQNASGDEFNLNTYLTNWNKLSPDARNALFSRFGPDFAESMDGLASVADTARKAARIGANPSGTAQAGAQIGAWTAFLGSLAHGNLGAATAIGGTMGSANLVARLMTNPRFVTYLAQQSKSATPQAANIGQLVNMANNADDPDLKAAAEGLREYRVQGVQNGTQGQ